MGLLRWRNADSRLSDEIQTHLDLLTEEHVRRGMPPEQARVAARRAFGGVTQTKEAYRNQRGFRLIESLMQDVRFTLRGLRRSPAFACTAVVILALGIGATTAMFSVVNSVLIRPLPYPDSEALVRIVHTIDGVAQPFFSDGVYVTYGDNNQAFQSIGVWSPSSTAIVSGAGEPEEVPALRASEGVLTTLGVQPAMGRWFSNEDDVPGAPATVILINGYWQRKFGGERSALERTVVIDSRPHRIIGVMPAGFRFRNEFDIILPLQINRGRPSAGFRLLGVARLNPGVTVRQADTDVARMLEMWFDTFGVNRDRTQHWVSSLRPLKEDVVGNVGRTLWVLMGTIAVLLLIACGNVTNLMLARAEARRQEFAVCAALGASWNRVARAILVEGLALAISGGVLGLSIAYGSVRVLMAMGPSNLPRLSELTIDPVSIAFACAISLASGVLFALLPILKYAGPPLATILSSGSRGLTLSRERQRAQYALMVVQMALALVLLVCAGLMIRSFQVLRGVEPGFVKPEQVQTFSISIPPREISEPQRVIRAQRDILEKLETLPGVTSAALTTRLPMDAGTRNSAAMTAEDKPESRPTPPNRHVRFVSPGMFRTLGTTLVAGRDFTWTDVLETREVAIVSENLAREFWGSSADAVGKRIREFYVDGSPWREIVGVAQDVHDDGVHQPAPSTVYWPVQVSSQAFGIRGYLPRRAIVALRSGRAGSGSLLAEAAEAVRSVHPTLPLAQVRTLDEVYNQSMDRTSFAVAMLAAAGSMALLLGVIGIYAVISYAVSRRTREIGIRMALGAAEHQIRAFFMRRAAIVAGSGVALGVAAAAGLAQVMSSMLFGVDPLDPITFVVVPLVLVAAALLASYVPARRASRVDPMVALRSE
jgi:predicted permease